MKKKNMYYTSSLSYFTKEEKEKLIKEGFTNFYDLQLEDEDEEDYRIVDNAYYNNVGCIATNFKINFNRKDEIDGTPFMFYEVCMNRYKPEEFVDNENNE